MNTRRSSWILLGLLTLAAVAPIGALAQSSTLNSPPQVWIYLLSERPCTFQKIQFSYGYHDREGSKPVAQEWTVSGPGAYQSWREPTVTVFVNQTGSFEVALSVTFDDKTVARNATKYDFYACDTPTASPAPTGCYYYNRETGKNEPCPTDQPTAAPASTQPYSPERCRELQYKYDQYKLDWSYRYNEAQDDATRRQLEEEKNKFIAEWQAEWRAAGCDYSTPTGDECAGKWNAAKPELESVRSRYHELWQQYWSELEAARREFAAQGGHSDLEWKEFEARWNQRAEALQSQMRSELNQIADRYGLRACGFYEEGYYAQPDVRPTYAPAPEQPDAYSALRSACEDRMIAIKSQYAARFEELYARLQSAPDAASSEKVMMEIRALEQEVAAQMETVIKECRSEYRGQYEEPKDFRDGVGSLQCYWDQEAGRIQCQGKYVSFQGNPQTQTLHRYTCGGQLLFDDIYSNRAFESFQFAQDESDSQLQIRSENMKLIFHDGPRGVINVGVVGDAEIYFGIATYLDVEASGNKVLLSSDEVSGAWLGGDNSLSWDAIKRVLTIRGEATWVSETCYPDGSKPDGAEDGRFWDAIHHRRLGAQIVISLDGDDAAQDNESYGDMEVDVEHQGGKKFLATIDSAEGTCKTVVLKFNSGIFESIRLRVVITDENGNDLTLQEASDLEDVLDPCDDGSDTFEYWIVQDRHGTQVLVSFAHFSEKRVSVEAAAVGNIVIPGFEPVAVMAVGAAVATVSAFRRRLIR